MLGRIVLVVVHSEHESNVLIFGRSRDDHFLYRTAHVLPSICGVGEATGGLDDDLRAHGFPRELRGILLCENLNRLSVYANAVGAGRNLVRQIAQDGVVLQKVSQGFGIGEVVDRYEVKVRDLDGSAQHVPANAPETVDADFDSHVPPWFMKTRSGKMPQPICKQIMLAGTGKRRK